jgi:hypothetical protein
MTISAISSAFSALTGGGGISSQDLQAGEQVALEMGLGMLSQIQQDAEKWQQVAKDNGLMDDFDSV